jgi:hypothetical protein
VWAGIGKRDYRNLGGGEAIRIRDGHVCERRWSRGCCKI